MLIIHNGKLSMRSSIFSKRIVIIIILSVNKPWISYYNDDEVLLEKSLGSLVRMDKRKSILSILQGIYAVNRMKFCERRKKSVWWKLTLVVDVVRPIGLLQRVIDIFKKGKGERRRIAFYAGQEGSLFSFDWSNWTAKYVNTNVSFLNKIKVTFPHELTSHLVYVICNKVYACTS